MMTVSVGTYTLMALYVPGTQNLAREEEDYSGNQAHSLFSYEEETIPSATGEDPEAPMAIHELLVEDKTTSEHQNPSLAGAEELEDFGELASPTLVNEDQDDTEQASEAVEEETYYNTPSAIEDEDNTEKASLVEEKEEPNLNAEEDSRESHTSVSASVANEEVYFDVHDSNPASLVSEAGEESDSVLASSAANFGQMKNFAVLAVAYLTFNILGM